MKNELLNKNLLSAIKQQIADNESLACKLMNILFISKEAAYRRIRGEVPFTFFEAAKIANKLNISLDSVIGNSDPYNAPFSMNFLQYTDMNKYHYSFFEELIIGMQQIKDFPVSELGTSSNILPAYMTHKYESLFKFNVFKWGQYYTQSDTKSFKELIFTDRLMFLNQQYAKLVKDIKVTEVVLDYMAFNYLCNDIIYFKENGILQNECVEILKKDLNLLIDDLEVILYKGEYENGHKINIYISDLNFESSYHYVHMGTYHLALIDAFGMNDVSSNDKGVYSAVKDWISSLKRFSTLISGTGEKFRIKYLKEQRKLVEKL